MWIFVTEPVYLHDQTTQSLHTDPRLQVPVEGSPTLLETTPLSLFPNSCHPSTGGYDSNTSHVWGTPHEPSGGPRQFGMVGLCHIRVVVCPCNVQGSQLLFLPLVLRFLVEGRSRIKGPGSRTFTETFFINYVVTLLIQSLSLDQIG